LESSDVERRNKLFEIYILAPGNSHGKALPSLMAVAT
jgi:hypothetical protein